MWYISSNHHLKTTTKMQKSWYIIMYHESLELDILPTSMRYFFFCRCSMGILNQIKWSSTNLHGSWGSLCIYSSFLHPKITAKQQQVKLASKRLQPTRMGNNSWKSKQNCNSGVSKLPASQCSLISHLQFCARLRITKQRAVDPI